MVAILAKISESFIGGLPAVDTCDLLVMRLGPLPTSDTSWLRLSVVIFFVGDVQHFPSRAAFSRFGDQCNSIGSSAYTTVMNLINKLTLISLKDGDVERKHNLTY